jgi:hypothetical protein
LISALVKPQIVHIGKGVEKKLKIYAVEAALDSPF